MTDRNKNKNKPRRSNRPQPDHPATPADEGIDLLAGMRPDDGDADPGVPAATDHQPVPAPLGIVDDNPPPYCGVHFVTMKLYKSKAKARYFRCPVDGCPERDATSRAHHPDVPKVPTLCMRCSQTDRRLNADGSAIVEKPGKEVAMELARDECTETILAMRCPACGHISRTPRPDLNRIMKRFHRGRRDLLDE